MGCLFPWKQKYWTMTAASYAADWCRRRETDADRVRIFECGGHLHVGHDLPYEPTTARMPTAPPPLTHRLVLPDAVLARVGMPAGMESGSASVA